MELRHSRVWNHHEVMYGINPKERYTLSRDDIRLRQLHVPYGWLHDNPSDWIEKRPSKNGLFSWLVVQKCNSPLRGAQHHWAWAHIIDAKHHIVCGLPQLHLREAQPRSFVPKEWEMMFSRCSKWCWLSVKWCCALRHKWKILVPKNEDFWLPLLGSNQRQPD